VTRERRDRDIDSSMSEMLAWKGMGLIVVFELFDVNGSVSLCKGVETHKPVIEELLRLTRSIEIWEPVGTFNV